MPHRSINTIKQEISDYISHADDEMLREIHAILKTDQEGGWWNEISIAQKSSIEQGIQDMKSGDVVSHEEMVKLYSKWLTK